MNPIDYSTKQCLVIEDRRPFLMLLKSLLTTLGAKKIHTEMSAEAGVRACKTNRYDIIISDLQLGNNRKNGFEFLEEIKKLKLIQPNTVFIMISGDSARSIVLGSIEKQPDDFLIKPFSQAQLNARIARALQRRNQLLPLYQAIDKGDYESSIVVCKSLMKEFHQYSNQLLQILVELLWKVENFAEAEAYLDQLLSHRQLPWALTAQGKTKLLKGDYEDAIELAKEAIDSSSNNVEAYDIIADAYLKMNKKPEAQKFIQEALTLSPLSIDRHFKVCEIARENANYELAMHSAKSIFELSQRSVHKNINHMCGYIRSILDLAENAETKNEQNKYLQESFLALQKAKIDETTKTQPDDFDFDIFESIVHARTSLINGKTKDAKKELELSQIEIEKNFTEYPITLAPDSMKLMLDLGDYEEASKLARLIKEQSDDLDDAILYLAETELAKNKEKQTLYVRHNKTGIHYYSQGKYAQAYEEFTIAKELCPLNIGVSLNLLQSLLKLIEAADKPEGKNIIQAKDLHKFIKNMPLKAVHQTKFDRMAQQISVLY